MIPHLFQTKEFGSLFSKSGMREVYHMENQDYLLSLNI